MRVVRRLAPPRLRGGGESSAHWGRGEYEFPAAERLIELSFCICRPYSLSFFVKGMWVTNSPRYQCALLLPPPSQVRGARPCTVSTPIATAQTSLQIPNLYSCCVKPIRTFRYSLSGLQTNAEYFFPKSQRIFYIPLDKSRSL